MMPWKKCRPSGGSMGALVSVGTSPCGRRTHGYAHSPLRGVRPPGMETDGHGDGWARIPIGKILTADEEVINRRLRRFAQII